MLVDVFGGITYGPDPDGWIGFDVLQDDASLLALDGTDLDGGLRALCEGMGWPWREPHRWTCDEVEGEAKRMAACIGANDPMR